jgi:hypothetical protein
MHNAFCQRSRIGKHIPTIQPIEPAPVDRDRAEKVNRQFSRHDVLTQITIAQIKVKIQ